MFADTRMMHMTAFGRPTMTVLWQQSHHRQQWQIQSCFLWNPLRPYCRLPKPRPWPSLPHWPCCLLPSLLCWELRRSQAWSSITLRNWTHLRMRLQGLSTSLWMATYQPLWTLTMTRVAPYGLICSTILITRLTRASKSNLIPLTNLPARQFWMHSRLISCTR